MEQKRRRTNNRCNRHLAASYNHNNIKSRRNSMEYRIQSIWRIRNRRHRRKKNIHTSKRSNGEGILENIVQITTGYYTGYALTTNGEVYGWGSNRYGELGQGSKSDDPVLYPTKMKKSIKHNSNIIRSRIHSNARCRRKKYGEQDIMEMDN